MSTDDKSKKVVNQPVLPSELLTTSKTNGRIVFSPQQNGITIF